MIHGVTPAPSEFCCDAPRVDDGLAGPGTKRATFQELPATTLVRRPGHCQLESPRGMRCNKEFLYHRQELRRIEMSEPLPRKLAAIFYADVAGYSRLTGDDEDATHRRLRDYLDLIADNVEARQGQIMHYAGDAVLAQFPAAVDALSSAVDIQTTLSEKNKDLSEDRKVHFRIGVNLGDIIEDRGDIYGDGVNVAARLEGLAEPGGICISESVHTTVGNKLKLDCRDIGEQTVKNIPRPVRAYLIDVTRADVQVQAERPVSPSVLSLLGEENNFELPDSTFHRGAALHEHEWRSGAGVFQRRHHRGHHH